MYNEARVGTTYQNPCTNRETGDVQRLVDRGTCMVFTTTRAWESNFPSRSSDGYNEKIWAWHLHRLVAVQRA